MVTDRFTRCKLTLNTWRQHLDAKVVQGSARNTRLVYFGLYPPLHARREQERTFNGENGF